MPFKEVVFSLASLGDIKCGMERSLRMQCFFGMVVYYIEYYISALYSWLEIRGGHLTSKQL